MHDFVELQYTVCVAHRQCAYLAWWFGQFCEM